MRNTILAYLVLVFIPLHTFSQYLIQGNIDDPQQAFSHISLEYLPSISLLNSTHADRVLQVVPIDSLGNFSFCGNELPADKCLYRLSLLKRSDMVSIQTGLAKNYMFLSLDNQSIIHLKNCSYTAHGFGRCLIEGSTENQLIQSLFEVHIDQMYTDFIALGKTHTQAQLDFLHQRHRAFFRAYCDSSTHVIAAMIAYQKLVDYGELEYEFSARYSERIKVLAPQSIYLEDLRLPKLEDSSPSITTYLSWLIGILVLCIIGLLLYIWKSQNRSISAAKTDTISIQNRLDLLSKKEQEVFQLMLTNQSNKEIAAALFIELSTVKTHVGKIYKKLGVNSRKELKKHFSS